MLMRETMLTWTIGVTWSLMVILAVMPHSPSPGVCHFSMYFKASAFFEL